MCCDNPPNKRNWRLYYLLDLFPPTTARQVKWHFRKVTLRHHYYEAYLVLYSRSRKYLYDAIGEDAYGFISSGTWGPFVPAFGTAGSVLLYSIVLLIEMALLLIFFAFLAAKDDNLISWSWASLVIPLIVFGAVMVAVAVVAVVLNLFSARTYREGMLKVDRLSPLGNLCAAIAYFSLPIVIGTRIHDDPGSQVGLYLTYMSMPIIGDVLYYATSLIWRWPGRVRLQMEVGTQQPSPLIYYGIFSMGFLNMGCGIAQWILLGYKLDGRLNRSWYVVFVPFCARAGLRVVEACLRSLMKYTIGVRSVIGVVFDTVGSFFSNGILLFSLYLVAVRIEQGRSVMRLAYALIPVYLTLGYIFVCLLVTLVVVLVLYRRLSTEERRINSRWTPPQEKTDSATNRQGNTDVSDTNPARFVKSSQRGWDDVDGTTPSSAAFPPHLDSSGFDGEYDDFDTEEENEQNAKRTSRLSQVPFGSPYNDDSSPRSRGASPIHSTDGVRRRKVVPDRPSNTVSDRDIRVSASHRSSRRPRTPEQVLHRPVSSQGDQDDYTEATTYLEETISGSRGAGDSSRGSGSYSYTEQTTYLDEASGQSRSNRSELQERSSSFSSSISSKTPFYKP